MFLDDYLDDAGNGQPTRAAVADEGFVQGSSTFLQSYVDAVPDPDPVSAPVYDTPVYRTIETPAPPTYPPVAPTIIVTPPAMDPTLYGEVPKINNSYSPPTVSTQLPTVLGPSTGSTGTLTPVGTIPTDLHIVPFTPNNPTVPTIQNVPTVQKITPLDIRPITPTTNANPPTLGPVADNQTGLIAVVVGAVALALAFR